MALIGKAKDSVVQVDCVIRIRFHGNPVGINLVQVYMPTSEYSDEEVEEIYQQIEEVCEMGQSKTCQIVMGDWNSQVGSDRSGMVAGPHGLGRRTAEVIG